MTLQNVVPWICRAQQEGWAVGAFNANTLEQAQAIVFAAQAEEAPAIIQVSHRALTYIGMGNEIQGLKYMAALGKVAARNMTVPIALHLDHGTERKCCKPWLWTLLPLCSMVTDIHLKKTYPLRSVFAKPRIPWSLYGGRGR